ncbi:P-loop containing nucleoside triphosphate hydrolase protein [Dipodascopsis uninucleata]
MNSFFKSVGTPSSSSNGSTQQNAPRLVPWVEKYRPSSLAEVSSQDHAVNVLKRTLNSSNLPHMLFYGPPGTGKTSTILALAKDLFGPELFRTRVLELNASDERGISIVREKVKNFARAAVSKPTAAQLAKYPCPPFKLIILDEADSMTQDAQSALRRTMETYSKITRFCLICNYVTRIIEPIASRCSKFRFRPLDSSEAGDRLRYICERENLLLEKGVIDSLLVASDGDLRRAITLLQSAARLQGSITAGTNNDAMEVDRKPMIITTNISVNSIDDISGRVPDKIIDDVVEQCKANRGISSVDQSIKLEKAVEDLMLDGWSGVQLLLQIHESLVMSEDVNGKQKNEIAALISESDKRLLDGADEHICILNLVVKIARILGKE